MLAPLKLKVRFRDCDIMEHVNNAVYLTYFEQARIHYFRQILNEEWDYKTFGIILLKNEINYIKPIHLNDEVAVLLYLINIGNKSFTLGYEIKVNDKLCTTGISVLVCFNFNTGQTTSVYPKFIEAFKKLEQRNV